MGRGGVGRGPGGGRGSQRGGRGGTEASEGVPCGGFGGATPFHHQNNGGRGSRGFAPRGGLFSGQHFMAGGRGARGGGHYVSFGGRGGGFPGGGRNYHHSDQRPYGKPPGLDFERKEQPKEQPVDYFIVLDLEGKQEILEFPVALINAKSLDIEDYFHRWVVTSSGRSLPSFVRCAETHALHCMLSDTCVR